MKKIIGLMVFSLLAIFFLTNPAFSADVAKIGVVDFKKIVVTSSAGKMVQKKLQAKGNEFTEKLKKMQKEISELENKLKTESMVLNQEKRDEKGREYRIKVNDFNQAKKKLQYDMKTLEGKEVQKIQQAVGKIVQTIGKKEGFLLILEKANSGVIYNPGSVDITDKVIAAYNKEFAKSK